MPFRLETGEHVLNEHEVGFFSRLRAPLAKAGGKLKCDSAVVLRERRICQHAVELADAAAVEDEWVFQGVAILNGEAGDFVGVQGLDGIKKKAWGIF